MFIVTIQQNNVLAPVFFLTLSMYRRAFSGLQTKAVFTVPKSKWDQAALKINNGHEDGVFIIIITFKYIITVVIAAVH